MHSKDLVRATKTATRVSEALSLLMMLGGFVAIIFGDFIDGIWIVVLGWFIRSGAETSLRQTLVDAAFSGITVGDIMTRDVLTVPPNISVHQLVSDYFLVHPHGGYPVTKDGEVLGVVTLQCARAVPKEKRDFETVAQAMVPCERTVTVMPTLSVLDAMQKMAREKVGRVLVVEGGRLLGMVTRGDLMRTLQTRQELDMTYVQSTTPISTAVRRCIQCGGGLSEGAQACPHCGARQESTN